jgi:hypothetical protein
LRPTSITCSDPATKYLPSRSYSGANGFNTNVSSNVDASNMGINDYTNAPTFLEDPDRNICFEPKEIDTFRTSPDGPDFDQFLPEWPPLNNSLHTASSVHDNYPTDFVTWPWPGTSSECSVMEVRARPLLLSYVIDGQPGSRK